MMTPRVVDISHHNIVKDLKATALAGVWGVIHKASQGAGYRDPDYAARRQQARSAGLLWGAYHFNDGSDVASQVAWFLKCAQPDDGTLLVLDFEDNPKSNMSIQQAVQFLRLLEQKTGRKGAIYSGNRLKETIGHLPAADRAYLCAHRLWLCQYGPRAVMPAGFSHCWLWQYTGDGIGPTPHSVAGIQGSGIDLNAYDGDQDRLKSEWAPGLAVIEGLLSIVGDDESSSSHARQAAADADESNAGGEAVDPAAPVAPVAGVDVPDPILLSVQADLKAMNFNPGIPTGQWGGMTAGAIAGFINDRRAFAAPPATYVDYQAIQTPLLAEIARAKSEIPPFTRPVTDARKAGDAATVATVAPEVVPAKRNFLAAAWASLVAFLSAVWTTISSTVGQAWDFVSGHKDNLPTDPGTLGTAWGYLGKVPAAVWIFMAAAGLGFIAWNSFTSVRKITESVQSGARQ